MDQVSRPMQIALVAVVLLAGMWFTVLKPKPAADSGSAAPVAAQPTATPSEPVAPGVAGLTRAVDKAKAASATSDATNAKIQQATGSSPAAASPAAKATPSKAAKSTTAPKAKAVPAPKTGTKAATAKAVAPKAAATPKAVTTPKAAATKAKAKPVVVDPSARLLAYLRKGKTLVILFHGAGADDRAARKAVHRTALADPKHVVSAYISIGDVGKYEAITSDVEVLAAPSILVIGTNGKATLLTGYVDAATVKQTVGDARRQSAADAKSSK